MDYTQRRIGSGEIVYAFGVLDIFNSDIVILDAHKTKSGANVVESLHQLQYFTNWIEKSFSFIPISKYFSVKCLKS